MARRQSKQSKAEVAVSDGMMAFQHDFLGRGPDRIRTYFMDDLAVVRSHGVLTPAEKQLSENPDGRKTIKAMRQQILEAGRATLEEIIANRTGSEVVSVHSDISVRRDEWMVVLVLDYPVGESDERN